MAVAAKKRKQAKPAPPPMPLAITYLRESRDFATGFLFIVPLLVGYEVGIALLRPDVVNWAHGIIRLVFHTVGWAEPVLFAGLVAMLVVLALSRAERLRIDAELFGLMLAESVVYASALGLVCSAVTRRLVPMGMLCGCPSGGGSLALDVVLSVGAGVYEELLFRVALLGALYYVLKRWVLKKPSAGMFVAIVVSSLVFSLCHHIGPYGDPWEAGRMVYRFVMGVAFAAIYIYRGLGIVVYTHALYDVIVSLGL